MVGDLVVTTNYMLRWVCDLILRERCLSVQMRLAHAAAVHTVTGDIIGSWWRGKPQELGFLRPDR